MGSVGAGVTVELMVMCSVTGTSTFSHSLRAFPFFCSIFSYEQGFLKLFLGHTLELLSYNRGLNLQWALLCHTQVQLRVRKLNNPRGLKNEPYFE